jgi:hypothetical protein
MPTLIRLVSVPTLAIAAWLATVDVLVVPARDPANVPLWAAIALGAAGFGVVSFVMTDGNARGSAATIGVAAAVLAVVALLIGSAMIAAARDLHPEGYLDAIGVVFAAHGALVIVWLGARLVTLLNGG